MRIKLFYTTLLFSSLSFFTARGVRQKWKIYKKNGKHKVFVEGKNYAKKVWNNFFLLFFHLNNNPDLQQWTMTSRRLLKREKNHFADFFLISIFLIFYQHDFIAVRVCSEFNVECWWWSGKMRVWKKCSMNFFSLAYLLTN